MPPDEPEMDPAEGGLVRSLARMAIAPLTSLVIAGVSHAALDVPEGVVARVLALVLEIQATLFAARFVTHIELKYWQWTSPRHRVLCGLMVVEGLIAVGFLMTGPLLFFEIGAPSPHSLSVLEFDAAIVLFFAILVQSLLVSYLVETLKLERGSENAKHCLVVRVLRSSAMRLELEWLVRRLQRTTPVNHLSVLVLWILISLCSVAFANSPSVGPTIIGYLTPKEDLGADATADEIARRASFLAGCGAPGEKSDLGSTIPAKLRTEMYSQWFGKGRGLGEIFGGCINPAHEVGHTGVWAAAGSCDGMFRSLAVATPNGPGAILLWGPGRFALEEAAAGRLLSATAHVLVGSGDMYTVTTTSGTSVFLRVELSNGDGGLKGKPRTCSQIKEDPVPFLRIPPALTRLWVSEMQSEERWLWPRLEIGLESDHGFEFHSLNRADTTRRTAKCDSETSCTLVVGGSKSESSGYGQVSIEKLMAYAPAPF